MKPLIILICALLTGCASFNSEVLPIENNTITITIQDNIDFPKKSQGGEARWWIVNGKKYCLIRLRKYPHLLGHEVRHCYEGFWHDEKPNGEDF
mgnify:FL=1